MLTWEDFDTRHSIFTDIRIPNCENADAACAEVQCELKCKLNK